MNNKLALILASFLLLYVNAAWAEKFSAAFVLSELKKSDSRTIILRYFDKPEWQSILKGIGTAEDNWLKVYIELRKGADGEAGEGLSAALWEVALPRAPFKVFAIEDNDSCEFTFEAECPPGGINSYLNRLEKALKKASTPEQRKMRDHCLMGIKRTRAAFPNPKAYCSH